MDVTPTDLLGRWSLERRVHDRRVGRFGRVAGTVAFVRDGDAVRWLERGTFTWDGRDVEVSRELLVVPGTDGWNVRFDDGRDFHPWQPGRAVTHPCRADVYCGLVDVDDARTRLRVLWDVTGPEKDQRIISRCHRSA